MATWPRLFVALLDTDRQELSAVGYRRVLAKPTGSDWGIYIANFGPAGEDWPPAKWAVVFDANGNEIHRDVFDITSNIFSVPIKGLPKGMVLCLTVREPQIQGEFPASTKED